MLATTTLWFIEKLVAPNKSVVVDTEIEVIAPVHIAIMAVLIQRLVSLGLNRRKKPPHSAPISPTIHPGFDFINLFLLHQHHFTIKIMYILKIGLDDLYKNVGYIRTRPQ